MAAWAVLDASGATGVWMAESGMDGPVEPGHSCERNGPAPDRVGRGPAVKHLLAGGVLGIATAPDWTSLAMCQLRLGCETHNLKFSIHLHLSGKPPSSCCGGTPDDLSPTPTWLGLKLPGKM